MNKIVDIAKNEPALVVGAVVALLGVLAAFGLAITNEQSGAIVAAVGALLALLGAKVTRGKVTPTRKLTPAPDDGVK